MEGSIVDHVRRVLVGEPIYGPPSVEFVPYIYTPLYYYVSALPSLVFGPGLFSLRIVSILSIIGCFAAIFFLVRRETSSNFYGYLSASLFAATFSLSGSWFDLARVDSLFLVLILLGIYLLRRSESWITDALAGAVFALSFLTKQTGLVIALPFVLYMIVTRSSWQRYAGAGTLFGILIISTIVLNALSEGWYLFYVFELPREHDLLAWKILWFLWRDLLPNFAPALVVAFFLITFLWRNKERDLFLFYLALFIGMVGASWLSRVNIAAYIDSVSSCLAQTGSPRDGR